MRDHELNQIVDVFSIKSKPLGLGQIIGYENLLFEGINLSDKPGYMTLPTHIQTPIIWLDSGEVLYGFECWYYPLFKGQDAR